jgi:hypothetical protein
LLGRNQAERQSETATKLTLVSIPTAGDEASATLLTVARKRLFWQPRRVLAVSKQDMLRGPSAVVAEHINACR